ncbi:MAG: hypothetical protein COW30_15340 [Rhodospirillales bacterium CG15_BIG_FIL_POST_REV_8_21_14_020_66_15]|nr:MAG: hypothetical protein COW30_15340 [Rhodospirillales bacterium CG15_BIG_FIL_POST_REV_8_21_14_020_66_15]
MKTALTNAILIVVSSVLTWVAVELAIFPALVPHMPLRLHDYLGEIEPLAQSSKEGLVPKADWILLVGDSYAKGNGDWLLAADQDANPPFQAAHVLHALTGRDVMNLGLPGVGSIYGWNRLPEEYMTWLGKAWRYRVEAPSVLFAYFYEGNDLNDNLRRVRAHFNGEAPLGFFADPSAVARVIEDEAAYRHKGKRTLLYDLFAAKFVRNLVKGEWRNARQEAEASRSQMEARTMDGPQAPPTALNPGSSDNAFRVAGRAQSVTGGLQSPAMELSDEQTAASLLVVDRALARLRQQFPDTRTVVVYLPAPLSLYDPAAGDFLVQTYQGGPNRFSAQAIRRRSDDLCRSVRAIAGAQKAGFIDARGPLRDVARSNPVHGPRDWKHLNRLGQEVLAGILAGKLASPDASGSCGRLADG